MITCKPLNDKSQTGREMHRLVNRFSGDLRYFQVNNKPISDLPIEQFFDIVKRLPYKKDTDGIEILTRPYHLFTSPFNGYDCKKKSIVMASWLKENNIPFRFIAVSSRPDGEAHHVIIQALINGKWEQIDPTYQDNILFENKKWTSSEILSGYKNGKGAVLVSLYGEGEPGTIEQDFYNYRVKINDPELLGQGGPAEGASAVGIIAVIVGIVASVTGTIATIVNMVQSRQETERQIEKEEKAQAYTEQIIKEQREQQQIEKEEAKKREKQLISIALIGGGAFLALKIL